VDDQNKNGASGPKKTPFFFFFNRNSVEKVVDDQNKNGASGPKKTPFFFFFLYFQYDTM
jgi:hypothetical protein